MKKIFTVAFITFTIGLLPNIIFAQNSQEQITRYVTSRLNDNDKQNIGQTSNEETQDFNYEEVKSLLQSIIDTQNYPAPEVAQNLSYYITEKAISAATGEMSEWEKKRSELYDYIKSSNWRTGKDISDADREFRETLNTIFFGLIEEAARAYGYDRLLDRLEEETMNKQDNNESIQVAIATVENNIGNIFSEEEYTTKSLYIDIQHNAFVLLGISDIDYKKLIKEFPEVKFLFDDMYTFFKWRYELRNSNAAYKLNENNINVSFRTAAATNSFFAFWELANIAKSEMKIAADTQKENLNTLTVSEERDNIKFFDTYAKQALYFGRIWNQMQYYAVKKGILPESLDPKRKGNKFSIKKEVKNSFQDLDNDQILTVLNNVRTYYVNAREISETYWNKWVTKQKNLQMQNSWENLLQQIQQTTANDTLNIKKDASSFGIQQ